MSEAGDVPQNICNRGDGILLKIMMKRNKHRKKQKQQETKGKWKIPICRGLQIGHNWQVGTQVCCCTLAQEKQKNVGKGYFFHNQATYTIAFRGKNWPFLWKGVALTIPSFLIRVSFNSTYYYCCSSLKLRNTLLNRD